MALGPKLDFINPGDALRASVVQKNFQALVNFVRAIPINNLLQPYQTTVLQADSSRALAATAGGAVRYFGYRRVNLAQAPETFSSSVTVWMRDDLAAVPLAAGEFVRFNVQKATPSGAGGRLLTADAWTNILPAPLEFNTANTAVGTDNVAGDPVLTYTLTGNPSVALTDGDWIRCVITAIAPVGPLNITDMGFQLSLKSYLRL